ncbi:DUF4097 family beta strand repeat-containing protein [Amycolatopsis regifaucium]|uniref:DUF4097 domain-containing protein n=1 Tax=Amycolatopsis regifaucium TaxID=546365 RepID=A0A154ML79_9PSEU|nr:DUF4097 family beta strand repeat-containing protein [Amycolatopsis regifaucium]KZB85061.1 hypothetical protein AVL48_02350 [Amycolatopsis regifaucium]OKA04085.1 hypothetical protein ATP06_0233210 [Amycolatopsis regifaucium]SFH95382.1 Putative adhesin [Amycolatopsis regifaucium]
MGNTEKRVLGALALGALTAFGIVGCTSEHRETLSDGSPVTEQITAIRVDVPVGGVTLRVEDGAPVSLRREVTYTGRNPGKTYSVDNGTLVLGGCSQCGVDYDVVVPRELAISGGIGTGKITLTRAASVDLHGDVGDLKVQSASGPVKLRTGTGDIEVGLAKPGAVTAAAEVGKITVTVPDGTYQVRAKSEVGGVETGGVRQDQASPNVLDLDAGTGKVTVKAA